MITIQVIILFIYNVPVNVAGTMVLGILVFIPLIYFFIRNEVLKRLSVINNDILEISKSENNPTENRYEEKILKLNAIYESLAQNENFFRINFEINELYKNTLLALKRLISELNTAKIFKINRNEFLGNVTHELRTPIFTIQLSLETLLDGAMNDETVNMDFLKRALNQTKRLSALVDDLIDISRLEAGMTLSIRHFEIMPYLIEIVNELSDLAKKRKLNIKIDSSVDGKTRVFGDRENLKQVFINLIDNSIKYSREGGEIIIGVVKDGEEIKISISDNGLGIPKKDLPRIFERFYRVDKTRSRDMGGSGLGLSIVKHILELHKSTIKVESEEGVSTKFEFNLPG